MSSSFRVFLGNLPRSCRERDIERFFDYFGRVRNIVIKRGNFGFCEFETEREANNAVRSRNREHLCGQRIIVEHAKEPRSHYDKIRDRRPRQAYSGVKRSSENRVIVHNLSNRASWQDLKDLMRRAGRVHYVSAHKDRQHEGVVEFESLQDMEKACSLFEDYRFCGRRITLSPFVSSRSFSPTSSTENECVQKSSSCDDEQNPSSRTKENYERNEVNTEDSVMTSPSLLSTPKPVTL